MDGPIRIEAASAPRCALCREALPHFHVACPGCATHLHHSCRALLTGCPTLGCAYAARGGEPAPDAWTSKPAVDPPPAPAPRRPPRLGEARVSPVAAALGVILVVLAILASRAGSERRVARAQRELDVLADAIRRYDADLGRPPRTLEDLAVAPTLDPRWLGPYVDRPPIDPWGNRYLLFPSPRGLCELVSYGADSAPNGAGDARDLSRVVSARWQPQRR